MEVFTLKKLMSVLLMPIPAILILIILGGYYWFRQKKTLSYAYSGVALLLLMLLSTPWLPKHLLYSLERTYPTYLQSETVDYILVLGCNHVDDHALPITSQLRSCSLHRLVEGIRILRLQPQAKLILSGGQGVERSHGDAMRELALQLGVSNESILVDSAAKDTEQEAQNLAMLLSQKRFILVTSASHMRRAMRIFSHANLTPIPAPTHHLIREEEKPSNWFWSLPRSRNLQYFEVFWYEQLGYWWLQVRGK